MLYREIIAVCSRIHTKRINMLCGQNVEFVSVKLVVHIVTTGICMINPLNAELNPICHLLALLGAHHILHISRIRVN